MMDGSITPSSSFPVSSSSSSSAIFRPRKSDDWNEYRTVIENLYRDNQLKLRDVKRIMERDYNFVASEKQYKDRLAAWHVRKNIKAKEVHVMIRKQQKRTARGKQTAFRVGGQEVDSRRIARFVRRYGASWENRNDTHPASPEPQTPSDMSCYTPEPDDQSSALSPLPELQIVHHEGRYEPLRSPDIDDNRSLSLTTLSPTSPHDTPKPMDENLPAEDPWKALDLYQDHIKGLGTHLDQSMAKFITPGEEY